MVTFHGQGTYTWGGSIQKYVGQWKDNNFHGQGTLISDNGDNYVGQWKDDKKHGRGKMIHTDGTIEEGMWEEGVFIGEYPTPQDPTPDTPFTNEDREYNMSIQESLQLKRFLAKEYTIEGIMDEETIDAIKALQTAASLPVTGIFDKATYLALSSNRYFGDK